MDKKVEILKVVIVDDELGMCLGTKRILEKFQAFIDDIETKVIYEVEYANTGKDFLDLLENKNINLVLLDYKLPDSNGFELLEKIIESKKDILTVMITAYATLETAVQATKLGAYDFLAKPFTPEEIRHCIRKATKHYLLAKHAKQLEEEKKKIRFQFISVLSHELKSPLNAIEGYINILKKRYNALSEEDYMRMLNRSQLRVEGMRKLIYDLLDLTRIESGQKKRNLVDVDVIEVINSAIELLEYDAQKKNITINFQKSEPIIIKGDRNEIEIIMNNLISNAIKYNKESGNVEIKINEEDEKIKISVSDTGIGLSKEEAGKLFNDFVRIKNSKTINIMGSGLGLSTVKKIAKLYKGDAFVESEPDIGSTFTIELIKNLEE